MITLRAKTIGDSLEIFRAARPDATSMSSKRFARAAGRHLETDYSTGVGLRMLEIDVDKCVPFIEIHHLDSGAIEVDWLVAVHHDGDYEVFDSKEALGYDTFIRASLRRLEAESEIKQKHYNKRKAEQDT